MATVQAGEQMGYAPAPAITSVITRYRDAGLPTPLTRETIQRVGVTESLAPRVIQGLRLLGLLDDDGQPTEQFKRLRQATTPEFKSELVNVVRAAYAPVFEVLEPHGATYEQVQDAFRTFKPEGQRDRMVALFLGLLDYAEYSDGLPTAGRTSTTTPSGRTITTSNTAPAVARSRKAPGQRGTRGKSGTASPPLPPSEPSPPNGSPGQLRDDSKTFVVQLGDAGTVTLTADLDMWLLDDEDMEFFVDLRKRVRAHQERHRNSPVGTDTANDDVAEEDSS